MALTEPIARLSRDRRMIFKDDPALSERLDVQYLALSAIDFVMERSAIGAGASPDDIVEHVAGECLPFLDRQREPARSRSPGQVVRLHLRDVVAEPLEGSAYVAREARLDGDDWNDMRRRDLEGNMLEIDDRLIS